jgi:hypothetical protein
MQIQILLVSALIFPLYAITLFYFRTVFFGILLYIAYVSTQIPIGFLLTRYCQMLGIRTKNKLKLIDPAKVGTDWVISRQEMNSEEISLLFDNISVGLQKYNPSVDDVIDLTWFVVIVWAVITTGIVAVFSPHALFYSSPAFVLAGLCLANLYNGYRVASPPPFDDSIEHLKHLVQSRLSALHAVIGKRYFQPGVRLLSKGKKQVVVDFFAQMLNMSNDRGPIHIYWLGLPSTDTERIDFDIAEEKKGIIQISLKEHPISTENGWTIKSSEPGVVLQNEQGAVRFDIHSTMVHSPSRIRDTSEKLADALKVVIHEMGR